MHLNIMNFRAFVFSSMICIEFSSVHFISMSADYCISLEFADGKIMSLAYISLCSVQECVLKLHYLKIGIFGYEVRVEWL
jgi:hypothetical protein